MPLLQGTLMQIQKSRFMFVFIEKLSENSAFLFLRILELFAREVCTFLEKQTKV